MQENNITVIVPPIDNANDDDGITMNIRCLAKLAARSSGEYLEDATSYGAVFENDTFVMNRYYWGDCDCGHNHAEEEWSKSHSHADDCYQSELVRMKKAAGWTPCKILGEPYLDRPEGISFNQTQEIEKKIFKTLMRKFNKPERGCAVHCTCDYRSEWNAWIKDNGHKETCSLEKPNFLHKPTGLRIDWYKYIGRDQKVENAEGVDLEEVFRSCVLSLQAAQAA